jgi:hypothetical protein
MIDRSSVAAATQNADEYHPQWSTWTRQVAVVSLLIAVVYAMTLLAPWNGIEQEK